MEEEKKEKTTRVPEAKAEQKTEKISGGGSKKPPIIPIIIGAAVLAAVVVILCIVLGKKDAYRVIRVNSFAGSVTYEREEKEQDVFEDMNLISRDIVKTGSGANIELLADSDKHIAAEEDTCFSIEATGNEEAGKIRIVMQYGTALYTIDNPLNEESEFEVETPNASLSVRGTIFRVSYDPVTDTTTVEVLEGKVKVETDTDSKTVDAGESATVTGDVITDGQAVMEDTDGDGTVADAGEGSSGKLPTTIPLEEEIAAIADASVGDIVYFGSYEEDKDLSNGAEPIAWYVLDKADGQAMLLAVNLLDCKPYHEKGVDITWEDCMLRSWLNSDFYNTAFSAEEQQRIPDTYVVNADNPYYGTEGGSDTTDKVFLLSLGEVEAYMVPGLSEKWEEYLNSGVIFWVEDYSFYCYSQDNRMCAKPTAYAIANGCTAYDGDISYAAGGGWWWLRSPGHYSNLAASVTYDGGVGYSGDCVDYHHRGVRPALNVAY